ncbi:serine/threonine-protein kinase [Hyalangium gracile]|uniref:serine/threonine-protein kinase n=1 Tax=Hyalangium gracile TaxID=394092 RepID=UPI001CC99B28|nr:serine/threonine-protein kinase [Hyalangium gracile]
MANTDPSRTRAEPKASRPGSSPQEAETLEPGAPLASVEAQGPAFPVPGWERYQAVRFLGQGGMGRVFLAYDVQLRRNVALKFVRDAAPELARRFLSEARAQARVRHERVCQVYEVGEIRGVTYIAMQYVEGQTLGQLAPGLSLEQKALVLREVAEGVHAAHRAGLIHRDLKPSNILVERSEDGRLHPYVLDFGLARDWREESLSTGTVLGTPHFMAPEQARGEVARLDRRADVYSLGATLYHLLTGQLPFTGGNELEVLARIQSEEPRPPRALDADVPADLEAIALKCLEKERSARYDSARALAEDLERFLNGEPVRARPVGPWQRLARKVRRHRAAVALGAVALLGVMLALGQAVWTRRELALRERISRGFTEKVERIEAQARYSGLSRLHDTREDRQVLRQRMEELEAEIREGGERAVGPGHYAVGRAMMALGDVEGARARLESAWQAGFREPRVAYALALVMGQLYQEKLLEVERVRNPEEREARRREFERQYREPTLSWLRRSEGVELPSPHYGAALLAFYEGRYDEALTHLDAMGPGLPWFHEAPLLRGDVRVARATARWGQGDRAGALADFEAGRQAYAAAAATAESVPAVHYSLARLEYGALLMELYGQGEVKPLYERGLQALTRALTVAPDHADSWVQQSRFHRRLAEFLAPRGGQVEPLLEQATAAARGALALQPRHSRARLELGLSLRLQARALQERGQDPRELLRQAHEAFESVSAEDRSYGYFTSLGLIFNAWADYEDDTGADSLAHRNQSIEAYRDAIKLDERQMDAWVNLGAAYLKRASRSQESERDLEQAFSALERARALNPRSYVPWFYEARVQEARARRLREQGRDAGPELERAVSLYQEALAINPQQPLLHNGLGIARLLQARQDWELGRSPDPSLEQAQAALEQARKLDARHGLVDQNLGEVSAWRAVYQRKRGEDPGPSVRAALGAYQRAMEGMPGSSLPWTGTGWAWLTLATWQLEHGSDPRPSLEQASKALQGALERNPRDEEARRHLGEVQAVRERWLASRSQARTTTP